MRPLLGWALAAMLAVAVSLSTKASANSNSTKAPDIAGRIREEEPPCWVAGGRHELECFHADPLLFETYPFTPEMLVRSANRYPTTDLGMHRAFQRARDRGMLKVVVLGGSVTFGHQCRTPGGQHGNECAWPYRLQQWFDERIRDFQVEVVNAATPAYDVSDLLHNQLRTILPVNLEVDLIIVDYGVNDSSVQHFDFDVNNIKLAHEVLIRYVRNTMLQGPALLYAESIISPGRSRSSPWFRTNVAEVHAMVTQKYDIPMASFRDAVWPDGSDDTVAMSIWGLGTHPDWQVQQLLADIVVYYVQKSYSRFIDEHGTFSHPSDYEVSLSEYQSTLGCLADERRFHLDATMLAGLAPPKELLSASNWSFIPDVHGVPGMIGFGSFPDEVMATFELPCPGKRRVLDIEYLVSYVGMGAVHLTVTAIDGDEPKMSVVVDGLWKSHASLQQHKVFYLPDEFGPIRVTFELLSSQKEKPYASFLADGADNSSSIDVVRADRKFKLVRIQCC